MGPRGFLLRPPGLPPSRSLYSRAGRGASTLEQMLERGDVDTVEAVIKARNKKRIASVSDYLMLADIYNENLNGVAAEVAVEKARFAGAIQSFTAV